MKKHFASPINVAFIILLLVFTALKAQSQVADTAKSPYRVLAPEGWAKEYFSFPPEFVPQLNWKGEETIRLHPDWEDPKKQGHFSYVFLWWLNGAVQINTTILRENFQIFYSGLVNHFVKLRHIPANKAVGTMTAITKIKTSVNDKETYRRTIHMLDFLAQKPMELHVLIHVMQINSTKNTALRVEASPMPFEHAIWKQLNQIKVEVKP